MTRGERVCAKLLLIAMQMSFLTRAAAQKGVPEDCVTGIYYTAIPRSIPPVCDPFLKPLSMLCRVQIHSNHTQMIDMNWLFAKGGVQDSSDKCPLLEGDIGIEVLNSTRHTVTKDWDPAEQTLSVTLTIDPLQEQDIGKYWCQASLLAGGTLSRTSAYCQRDAAETLIFKPFSCNTLFKETNVCVTQTPQTTPAMLISSISALSSLASPISNSPTLTQPSSLVPSATSVSDFSRSSYFETNTIVSSMHTRVGSSLTTISSSPSHYHQSPTSTFIPHISDGNSSNDVLVMSIIFCTLSAIILLVTVIIALSVIKCHQRMRHWVPEHHINEAAENSQSMRQMDSQTPHPITLKTIDSTSSDNPAQFQIHQTPQNPLHSTLQNMSINLGPVGPSSMSVGPSSMSVSSDIYSEIGPPLRDSSLSNHETQRNSPPIPPRPVTSRQENLYDVPETDDARSITSHTYTLPADARGGTTISSTQVLPHNTAEWLQHTSNTRDSWFGQCSPILVIQQRCSTQADVLDGIPVGVSSGSFVSLQSQALSETQETATDSDNESGVRSGSSSITHEPLEAYLPPYHSWVMVHSPLAKVQPTASVSPQFPRAAFMENMQDTAQLRPSYIDRQGCTTDSNPPPPFTQPNRLLVSNTGKSSPSPSTSSGCTDLSKYSGDYERDPLYMERVLQQGAVMVESNNELLSSAESTYSPLSPIPPPQTSREHHYTPLDCHSLEPTPAYSRLQRHTYQVIETTV